MYRRLGLIGILLVLSVALGTTNRVGAGADRQHLRESRRRTGQRRAWRDRHAHQPGAAAAAHRRHRFGGRAPVPRARSGHVHRVHHAAGLPDDQPRERRRPAEPDDVDRPDAEGRRGVGGDHRQGRDARRRHEERHASTSTSTRCCSTPRRAARTSGTSSNTRSRASCSTRRTSAATRPACSAASRRAARRTRRTCSCVNGVNVGDPAAIGFSMNYYEPSTFENIQVTTGAQDISMGTSGTLINMVTRSGTNRFGGQTLAHLSGQADAVGQRRRDAEAERVPAGGAGASTSSRTSTSRPAARSSRTSCSTSARQRPADARQRAGLSRRCRRRRFRRSLSGNTQDTTDIYEHLRQADLRAERGRTGSRATATTSGTTSRTAARAPPSRSTRTPKEYDTFVIIAGVWNTVVTGPARSATRRSPTATRTSR